MARHFESELFIVNGITLKYGYENIAQYYENMNNIPINALMGGNFKVIKEDDNKLDQALSILSFSKALL